MNEQEAAHVAHHDQWRALQRDYAMSCKEIHDEFMRAGWSPEHAFTLTLRQLDRLEGWFDEIE